jgi:hypothetical protein
VGLGRFGTDGGRVEGGFGPIVEEVEGRFGPIAGLVGLAVGKYQFGAVGYSTGVRAER